LAKYFDTTVEFWFNLQTVYELAELDKDAGFDKILKDIPKAKKPAPGKAADKPAKKGAKAAAGKKTAKAAKSPKAKAAKAPKKAVKRAKTTKAALAAGSI
jgi:hypothetical protein